VDKEKAGIVSKNKSYFLSMEGKRMKYSRNV
jgi:hypothetical protein